ncbi:MAG: hypothetical protein AAF449_04340 [Myxococcota bacterium]
MKIIHLLLPSLLWATACTASGSIESTIDEPSQLADPRDQGPAVIDPTSSEIGQVARRITVDQMRQTIPMLFGGITWTLTSRGGEAPAFDVLSRTLGEPDYIEVTTQNTDPSALFAKFMDDMAGDVCNKAVTRDQQTADIEQRLVARYPEEIERNLRYLRLKLHGIYVPEDRLDGLEDLAQLYRDVVDSTQSAVGAWYAVCVAMVTAPEFLTY